MSDIEQQLRSWADDLEARVAPFEPGSAAAKQRSPRWARVGTGGLIAASIVGVLVLGGLNDGEEKKSASVITAVGATATDTTTEQSAAVATVLVPVVTPLTASWNSAVVSPDGRTVTITFDGSPDSGVDPACVISYRAEATETTTQVHVRVYATLPPQFGAIACPAVGRIRSAQLQLTQPLGTRALINDGTGATQSVDQPGSTTVTP